MEGLKNCFTKTTSKWRHLTRAFPLGSQHHPVAVKWLCLAIGCLGMAASSSVWQNCWQNAMRAIYNQTETQSNLVSTLGGVGATVSLPAGLMYEAFGSQMNALLALIMCGFGYFFLWIGTGTEGPWRQIFAENQWLVQMLYFFVGFGCSFGYMAILLPNATNFHFDQRGKVFGLLDASLSIGPTLLTILYNSAFTNGHIQPGEEDLQNLSGYFLILFFFTVLANILVFFFVGSIEKKPLIQTESQDQLEVGVEDDTGSRDESLLVALPAEAEDPPNLFSEFPFAEVPLTKILFKWNYYFVLAQFVLSGCLQTTYQANIATYLRSFNMNDYNLLFTSLNLSVQAASKFGAGFISDMIAHRGKMPRAVVFLIPYILQTVVLFASAFFGDNFIIMLLTTIVIGASTGVTWCQTPTLLGELFGSRHLGSNYGLALCFTAALGFPFSISFSAIYEAAIYQPGEIYCYGLGCFTWSFILLGGVSLCSLIMAVGLTQNMYRNAAFRRMSLMTVSSKGE